MKTSMKAMSVVAAIAMVASLLTLAQPPQSASAAVASQFNPGNIIDDGVFFNGAGMSSTEVQSFLSAHVPTCYSSYACLSTYRQDTPSIAASPGRCTAYNGRAGESAAEIIAHVGAACNINPKAILVLLQKEMSLVTMNNPAAWRFSSATGYSCPDTAACNPAFAGFFYQIYYAAKQYQTYVMYPNSFNHQAGRYNNVRFHPNAACGTSSVFIQNKATAGLYNYTPYQPNASALANLYGEGDGCASYGNRNFWRIFTDWFGSPTVGSSLVRTTTDASIYLTSGNNKYPVSSSSIFGSLFPLGPVAYVSQAYLDGFTTAHTAGRVLRSPSGSIYFFDAGIKLPFGSCDLVVDYGGSCAADGYVQLTDAQIGAFVTGPAMTPVMGTREGGRYAINDGVKREILDERSQVEAGLTTNMNVLSENALADLSLGGPIVRDSAYMLARGTSTYTYFGAGSEHSVSGSAQSLGIPSRTTGTLSKASLDKIPDSSALFTGSVKAPASPAAQLVTDLGRYIWTPGAGGTSVSDPVLVSNELLESYSEAGTIDVGSLIKTASSATVYSVMATDIKPIGSWTALLSLSPTGSPVITTVSDRIIESAPKGSVALTAGSLVRSPDNASIYFINGVTNRIPVTSFDMTTEAGITGFEFFPGHLIAAYPQSGTNLGFGYSCGAKSYVAAGGSLHEIAADRLALYPIEFMPLDKFTCAQMKYGAAASNFIRTADGSIFMLDSGVKKPISSMARFADLGGEAVGYLNVHARLANLIPTGPPA